MSRPMLNVSTPPPHEPYAPAIGMPPLHTVPAARRSHVYSSIAALAETPSPPSPPLDPPASTADKTPPLSLDVEMPPLVGQMHTPLSPAQHSDERPAVESGNDSQSEPAAAASSSAAAAAAAADGEAVSVLQLFAVGAHGAPRLFDSSARCVNVTSVYFREGERLRIFTIRPSQSPQLICVAHAEELLQLTQNAAAARATDSRSGVFREFTSPSEVLLLRVASPFGPSAEEIGRVPVLTMQGLGRFCATPFMWFEYQLRHWLQSDVIPRMMRLQPMLELQPRMAIRIEEGLAVVHPPAAAASSVAALFSPKAAARLADDAASVAFMINLCGQSEAAAAHSAAAAAEAAVVCARPPVAAAAAAAVGVPFPAHFIGSHSYQTFAAKWEPRGYTLAPIPESYWESYGGKYDALSQDAMRHWMLRIRLTDKRKEHLYQMSRLGTKQSQKDRQPTTAAWSCACGRMAWSSCKNVRLHLERWHGAPMIRNNHKVASPGAQGLSLLRAAGADAAMQSEAREFVPLSPSSDARSDHTAGAQPELSESNQLYCDETLDDLDAMQEEKYGEDAPSASEASVGVPVLPLLSTSASVSSTAATVAWPPVATAPLETPCASVPGTDPEQPINTHSPIMRPHYKCSLTYKMRSEREGHPTVGGSLRPSGWAKRSDRQQQQHQQPGDAGAYSLRIQEQPPPTTEGSSDEKEASAAAAAAAPVVVSSDSGTDSDDPTEQPTGFHCSECNVEFKMGQTWFACNDCDDWDMCVQCRRGSTHAEDEGHSFGRRECRGRMNAVRRSALQKEKKKQGREKRDRKQMQAQKKAALAEASSADGVADAESTPKQKKAEPSPAADEAEAEQKQQQQADAEHDVVVLATDADSDSNDHSDGEAEEKRSGEEEHASDDEAESDSDGDFVVPARRSRDIGRSHTCGHTCGCLDAVSRAILPHPKVCAGSRTLVWRHEARTAVHPNHDDATCPIRFDQGLMRVDDKPAADATAAAPSSASAAAAAGGQVPWKCPHSCGCYVHADGQYVTHRVVSWANRSKHMASAYVHTRCGPGCPEFKDDAQAGSSAAAAAAPLPDADTPADRKAVVQCPHTCGCFMIHHSDSKDKTIRYGAFVRQSMARDRLKASHLHNINCHPRHAGSGCPVAMPTERVRFTVVERPPIKSRPAPDAPSASISDEAEVIACDSDDSDEPLVADSDRVLRQHPQPRQSATEHAQIPTFDAAGCDVQLTKLRLYGGSILRVYSVRERATGNVRGIFVRKAEIAKWWVPENKYPLGIFERFSVPAEANRLKTPDQIRGPPAVLTPLGIYRMQKPRVRSIHGSVPKRNFVLTKLLPALRSLAPNVAHHRSVVAALDASIVVPGESASAIPAPARQPSPPVDLHPARSPFPSASVTKVACRHSCGCVHRGHAGMTVFHKLVSMQHAADHEASDSCHPMCGPGCSYHAVDTDTASSSSAAAAARPVPNANRVFWRQFTLTDLRDWGRDFDGSADVADDLSVTKDELIDVFIELDVPKPGSPGQPTMEEHIREFRARGTSADPDLVDRQNRAREVLERTQKRQAAHAAALLGASDPKKQRLDQPDAAAAASSHAHSVYQPAAAASSSHAMPYQPAAAASSSHAMPYQPAAAASSSHAMPYQPAAAAGGYPFGGMPAAPMPSSMHYAMPPPGLSQQALAAFFEYRAQLSQPMPASSFSAAAAAAAAPQPPMPMQGVVMQGADSAAPDASLCIVCADNKRSVVFPGCNHFVCCRDCAEEIRRSTRRECPLCRTRFGYKTMITGIKF